MMMSVLAMFVLMLCSSYVLGRKKAQALAGVPHAPKPNSRPNYYGYYVVLWSAIPALCVLLIWLIGQDIVVRQYVLSEVPSEYLSSRSADVAFTEIRNAAESASVSADEVNPDIREATAMYRTMRSISVNAFCLLFLGAGMLGLMYGRSKIQALFTARVKVEQAFTYFLISCSTIAVLTTIGIVCSLLFESIRFFSKVPIHEFLFGLSWSPQTAMRADQVAGAGAFGAVPVLLGTVLISAIAMSVAVPLGLLSAVYLSEYASRRVRSIFKPLLEILAGIPTVVYGFFAALTVAPFFRDLGLHLGLTVSSESALAAGVVMGVMIIPFISSLSDDVINAVPQTLRDGSYAIGATKSETIKHVVLPAALPGIVGAVLLAVSRAIGETMIVVMAAGLVANLSINPLENVTTVTVQIVTILVGDQEFDSPKTLAAFALGLLLFVLTLALNLIALRIVKRYREKYD